MIRESIAYIANYLWMESIHNMSIHLTETERKSFSNNDYYYLTKIYYMGRPNFGQVAEALKLTKPAISAMVAKLSKLGLVEKVQSEEDKRMFFIQVTPKGQNIMKGDEALYKRFETMVGRVAGSKEQYDFVESMLGQMVQDLSGQA